MYIRGEFQRERERIRARIEANRSPAQKIEAGQVRALRAAYDALPNSWRTEIEELEVFRVFAAVALEAGIDPSSGVNAVTPEPDVRCTVAGARRYFELGEITDLAVARSMADAIKYNEPRGCAFSQELPFMYIIEKKRSRSYSTSGAPVELLLYYRTQSAPPLSDFENLLNENAAGLQALVASGPFLRVWIFDFLKKRVLWHT